MSAHTAHEPQKSASPTRFLGVTLFGIAAMIYGIAWVSHAAPPANDEPASVAGPGYYESLPAMGPEDAKVVLIEVADLKCHMCAVRNGLMMRIIAQYARDVRIVFKHFPFVSADDSERGARATMAAGRQGRFWEYKDLLFQRQAKRWTDTFLVDQAKELGLDPKRFLADLYDPSIRSYVRLDRRAAEALNIHGTPTLFINGRAVRNDANADTIRMMIRNATAEVDSLMALGLTAQEARAESAARRSPMGGEFAKIYMNNDVTGLRVE